MRKDACIFGKNSISLTNQKFGIQAKILYSVRTGVEQIYLTFAQSYFHLFVFQKQLCPLECHAAHIWA